MGLVLCATGACGSRGAALERPSILVIYLDDLGFGDVGYLESEIRTPGIDAFARSGMILERFYASPMCTPSRAQLLTGRHAAHFGLHANVNAEESQGLPEGVVTLPELLGQVGYETHLIGKWHLGHLAPEHHPQRHGFDHFYGHLGGWIDYTTHLRDDRLDWQRDGEPLEEAGYSTDLLAREAARVIETHDYAAAPLFVELSFNAPHTPLHRAPDAPAYDALGVERGLYRGMVERLDSAIDSVLRALERADRRDDFLIWLASDNGGSLQYGASNAPLSGGKFSELEGGLRVPAVLSWPGHIASGARSELVTTNLDMLPTLARAAGVAPESLPPELDGRDLLQPLLAGEAPPREDLFFAIRQRRNLRTAILRGPLKLLRVKDPEEGLTEQLFDVFADPAEQHDLARDHPAQFAAMRAELSAFEQGFGPAGL